MSKTKTSSEGLDDRSIAIDSIILERLERAKRRFPRLCSLDSFRALNEEALESDAARKNGEDVNTKRVLRKAAVALMQIEITISIASLLRKVIKHVLIESIEMLEGDYGSHMSEREYELCACSIVFCAKLLPHCRDVVREFLRKMRKPLFERVNERRRRRVGVMGECRGRREMDGGDDDHEHARIVLRSSRYAQECFGCESGSGGASGVSWDWSACGAFMNHEDLHTRWIAIGLVCVALGLSDDAVHAARKRLCSTSAADEDDETAFLLADFQRDWDEHETAFRLERASFLLPTFIERITSNNSSDQFDVTIEEEDDDDLENIPAAPGHERLGVIEVRAKQVLVEEIASPTLSMAQKEEKKKKKKSNNNSSDASDFVLVPSAERNLVAVAYALCQNRPVLLEGPAGCGKSATLREAARRFGRSSEDNDVIVLHFDAHTDSKSLLGAYVCGASPGEFEWQPGSLTRAVKSGKWVLIEDVDVAPFEVLSALIPLLEERKLYIAGRGEIVVAHPQFQLFGSATIGGSKVSNRENDPLGGLWTRVSVEQPSGDEPGKILSELYPQLSDADVRGRMLKTMRVAQTMVGQGGGHASRLAGLGDEHFDNAVSDDNNNDDDDDEHNNNNNMMMMMDTESNNPENENRGANNNGGKMTSLEDLASNEAASQARATVGRPFTLRDLLRWAKRATSLRKADLKLIKKGKVTPPQARQAMYDEAADVLLGALPPGTGRRRALEAVAEIWGLHPEETANTTDLLRKPDVLSSEDSVRVGRTMLPCEERDDELENFRNFAKTGHALRMLERVSCAVSVNEPALLVGETGTGKTALVQELARLTGAPLTVVNLSNQSESSDFLGGFRPAGARHLCLPLLKKFLELFGETFPSRSNADFLGRVSKFAEKRKWVHLLKAFRAGVDRVASVVDKDDKMEADDDATDKMNDTIDAEVAPTEDVTTTRRATRSQVTGKKGEDENSVSPNSNDSNKRQKTSAVTKKTTTKNSAAVTTKPTFKISDDLVEIWQSFDRDLVIAERAIGDVASSTSGGPIFAFVEGALVTALREGHWILLDEINLAPAETLERLNGVLESRKGSIVLSERGDATPVYRHPRFRLFAAMNPATDVGKRDLPPALKHRFAEVYCGETESREDLQLLVRGYLRDVPSGVIAPIVDFYVEAKRAAHSILLDSADQKPRYSLRTLARALEYVSAASPLYGVQRAMMDGFSMSFLTLLKKEGQVVLEKLMHKHLLGGKAIKVRAIVSSSFFISPQLKLWACQYSMACSV
jgi:MoxR-like ATPase